MILQEVLTVIAEVSVSLAGFTGLIAAFHRHDRGGWSEQERLRIITLVVLSFTMIVCSLAPFALIEATNHKFVIWGCPMLLYASIVLGLITNLVVKSWIGSFSFQYPIFTYVSLSVGVILHCIIVLSAIEFLIPLAPYIWILGMLWSMVFGATVLLAMLSITWRDHGQS